MNDFREFVELKEEQKLNEQALATALVVLAIPSAIAFATWGSSIVVTAYVRFLSKIINGIVRTWRNLFSSIRGQITEERVRKNVKEMSTNPKVREHIKEMKETKRKFQDELSNVFDAIDKKDWSLAKEEFDKIDKNLQNSPDVHKAIISEVSKTLKEPPLYVQSPGNRTYQAIKKIINIRVARAAAVAAQHAIEGSFEDDQGYSEKKKEEE